MKTLVLASCAALFIAGAAQAQTAGGSSAGGNTEGARGANVETSNPEMTKRSSGSVEAGPNSVKAHPAGEDGTQKSQPNQ